MKKYYFNKELLTLEPVNEKKELFKRSIGYIIIIIGLLIASFKPYSETKVSTELIPLLEEQNRFSESKFIESLKEFKIKYPDVVWAQSKVESANYSSPIFKENYNMLGLKVSTTRPTTSIGENRGHAAFDSWRDCVIDYAIWQSTFTRGLNKEEYIKYLGAVYAEDPLYEKKIRAKMKLFKK